MLSFWNIEGQKKTKTLVIRHLGYSKKSMTSQQGKIRFLKKQLANMFDVKILRDLYIYTSYINYEVLKIFCWNLTNRQQVLYSLPCLWRH